jgi:hypothetical protein
MRSLASCQRCGAALADGNAQAVDPSLCAACLHAPAPQLPTGRSPSAPLPFWRRPLWLAGAGLVLALVALLVAGRPGGAQPESDLAEPAAIAEATLVPPPAPRQERAAATTTTSADRPELPMPREAPAVIPGGVGKPGPGEGHPGLARPGPKSAADRAWLAALKGDKAIPRRNRLSEEALRLYLAHAEEVGLGSTSVLNNYTSQLNRRNNRLAAKGPADASFISRTRPDLALLPFRDGPGCRLPLQAAREMDRLARKLRGYLRSLAPPRADGNRTASAEIRDRLFQDLRGKQPEWLRAEAVPTLNQMLMGEDGIMRQTFVELLAAIPGQAATEALAARAVFDIDPAIRAAAVRSLEGRSPEHWRPVLLKALNYPWPPPADFAAEALVHLQDRDAVADLISLLDMPPPDRPFARLNGRFVVREVVRVNHLTNCMLCHPPAITGDEPVLGVDPVQSLPKTFQSTDPVVIRMARLWVASGGGPGGGGLTAHDYADRGNRFASVAGMSVRGGMGGKPVANVNLPFPLLIRGDITFLRQDFSLSFPAPTQAAPGPGQPLAGPAQRIAATPPPVRFDYVVRTRPITTAERKKWSVLDGQPSPQREAVLFTLRELTGEDHGDDADAWARAFPLARAEVQAVRLADRIVRAEKIDRLALLARYRDAEGIEYAWALRRAIPRLAGSAQEIAQRTLAARLARIPATAQLRAWLCHPDDTVRRAGVLACLEKEQRDLSPELTALLSDDPALAALARASLGKLTSQPTSEAPTSRPEVAPVVRAGD